MNYESFILDISLVDGQIHSISHLSEGNILSVIPRELKKGKRKLYVVTENSKIVYVGVTILSLSTRINYGFRANGKKGYHGYKWKVLSKVTMFVFVFENLTIQEIENIEAELVYNVREKTGKWPDFQNEIHFNNLYDKGRSVALRIYEQLMISLNNK